MSNELDAAMARIRANSEARRAAADREKERIDELTREFITRVADLEAPPTRVSDGRRQWDFGNSSEGPISGRVIGPYVTIYDDGSWKDGSDSGNATADWLVEEMAKFFLSWGRR
jgi:hypothetical protein